MSDRPSVYRWDGRYNNSTPKRQLINVKYLYCKKQQLLVLKLSKFKKLMAYHSKQLFVTNCLLFVVEMFFATRKQIKL